jgi:hypothetical protein
MAEVSGTVTYRGQQPKVKGVQISFLAADGRMASANVAEDGTYKADGVPVGDVGVSFVFTPIADIQQRAKAGPKLPKPGQSDVPDVGSRPPLTQDPIPPPLRDASTSKVVFKVESGKKNVFNYDIKP